MLVNVLCAPLSAAHVLVRYAPDYGCMCWQVEKHLVSMRVRAGGEQPSTAQKVLEVIYLLEKKDSISGAVIVNGDGAYLKNYQHPLQG